MIVKSFRSERYSSRYCIFTDLSNLKTRLTHSDPLPDPTRYFGSGKALTRPDPIGALVKSFLSDTISEATRNKMKIFVMGDLNCHSDKWMHYVDNGLKAPFQFNILKLLASNNMIDSLSAFHEDYLT